MADEHEVPYRGEFPDVQDEAAGSPMWLPGVGFAILSALALFVAIQAATAHEAADAVDTAGAAGVEAGASDDDSLLLE